MKEGVGDTRGISYPQVAVITLSGLKIHGGAEEDYLFRWRSDKWMLTHILVKMIVMRPSKTLMDRVRMFSHFMKPAPGVIIIVKLAWRLT